MSGRDRSGFVVLVLAVVLAGLLTALTRPQATTALPDERLPLPAASMDASGRITIVGDDVRYTLDGSVPWSGSDRYDGPFHTGPRAEADRMVHTPSSVQWRHPIGSFEQAVVLRMRTVRDGAVGPVVTTTLRLPHHGPLPVVSLVLPAGALFDPDSGLYVPGHAVFDQTNEATRSYPRSNKWWRYPGNYHGRGSAWERTGHITFFNAEGRPEADADMRLRIHGNNTRGFAQHALRVLFDKPGMQHPVLGAEQGGGQRSMLLRAAGNDQDRCFLRDALQHRLCANSAFETSAARQTVLYINGAYWGIHNLRERIDDKELARRHGLRPKDIVILADRLVLQEGDPAQVARFSRFLTMTERWDAGSSAFVDSLERSLDVDGFLQYMAAQMVLGNMDWPEQNVKWWRYTGAPDTVRGPRDGRWRFIMGDSDIGFGLSGGLEGDLFAKVRRSEAPVARLLKACLRSEPLRERWDKILDQWCSDRLSAERMTATAGAMAAAIRSEMPRHTRRWRRPADAAEWERHVADLMTFARERTAIVRAQWERWKGPPW